jgi:long-chain acyl-CoA synthetase
MEDCVPDNIARFLTRHLARPGHVLYRHFVDQRWRDVTAGEIAALAARWQDAFRREGYGEGDRVALVVRNGIDWVAIDLAALGLGLAVVPLYVDDNPESIAWSAAHVEARLLIVQSSRIAAALRGAGRRELPPLLVLRPAPGESAPTAATFLRPGGGGGVEVRDFPQEQLATICFTSGTAGRPKGVMLSHGNIIANVRQCEATRMGRADDRFLSILPLSHMFERTAGYYLPLSLGAVVVHARGLAEMTDDLRTQRPTVIIAVPRIYERFRARIERAMAGSPGRRRLYDACVARGGRVAANRASVADRLLAPALRALVGRPVLARMGGRLRVSVVGGAALDPDLARNFIALGLPLLQGYGMTEASPVISVNRIDDNDPQTVGPPLPGVEARLAASGELLVRGDNVMLGYWRDAAASRAAIDEDRWLHTGDVAEFRGEKIVIRGRVKDICVMSNGEKLSPQDVELAILRDPVFEQVMLVGEGRPYPILLAATRETDENALVQRANAQLTAFPRWARVRRVIGTPDAWTVENGLLTPTLKLRRPFLAQRYGDRIERAYGEAPVD